MTWKIRIELTTIGIQCFPKELRYANSCNDCLLHSEQSSVINRLWIIGRMFMQMLIEFAGQPRET